MPWFPDFVAAAELVRRDRRVAGRADPVSEYLRALSTGDAHELEEVWPGEITVFDPLAGEVRGHRKLARFVARSQAWLADHVIGTEPIASTSAGGRAAVELVAHVEHDGERSEWPVAVVAESHDERSVVFRTYCTQQPVVGERPVRGPILDAEEVDTPGVVARYQTTLAAGDTDAVVATFAPDGYLREAVGPMALHVGLTELRAFFADCFDAGGGIRLEACRTTDDGARCALEYNCTRWGNRDLPPQAGVVVLERGASGRLAAARIYDDVVAPARR